MRVLWDRFTGSVAMVGLLIAYGLALIMESPVPLALFAALFVAFLALRLAVASSPRLRAWVRLRLGGGGRVFELVADIVLGLTFMERFWPRQPEPHQPADARKPSIVDRRS